jgi:protein gp37
MAEDWATELRDATHDAGAAYFVKQLGGYPDKRGKEKAVLDGRTWRELPAVAQSAPNS